MSTNFSFPDVSSFAFRPMLVAPAWMNALMQAGSKAMTMTFNAQQVIAMRLTMLAIGGNTARNRKEVERMFTEKMAAVNESTAIVLQLAATMAQALPTTFTDPQAAERMLNKAAKAGDKAITPFARRVAANHKRLSR